MRRYYVLLILFIFMKIMAQVRHYEFDSQLPVYYGEMKSVVRPALSHEFWVGDFAAWQRLAHSKLLELAGPFPPDTAFDARVVGEEQREGYAALEIALNVSAWCRVSAYLLVPDGAEDVEGGCPAVVVMHDHGAHFSIGKEKVIRPIGRDSAVMADAAGWSERCYGGVFIGDELARQGYVVLAIDAPYFGERGSRGGSRYVDQQAIASNLLLLGYSWAGLTLHDDLRSLDYLRSLPYVDAGRIGAVGFSYGAYRAWMLSAASLDVAATVSVCWMSSVAELVEPGNNITRGQTSLSMYIPLLNHYLDFPDVASIAGDTPALYIQGSEDKLFTPQSVERAFNIIRHCNVNAETVLDDEGHVLGAARQSVVWDFLNRHLRAAHD